MSGTRFRPLRKAERGLSQEAAEDVLRKGEVGFLGVNGDNGYPYVVALNYCYDAEGKSLYFHCAREGHKLDAIKADNRVCFAVVTQAQVLPDALSMLFESVTVFGRAHIVEGTEKEKAVFKLTDKYVRGRGTITPEEVAAYVEKHIDYAHLVRIDIEHLTGKKRRE